MRKTKHGQATNVESTDEHPSLARKLQKHVDLWSLRDPVLVAKTTTSEVYKVRRGNEFAALKILNEKGLAAEADGALALKHFDGRGAVRVFEFDHGAVLMEHADGPSLGALVASGKDQEAADAICDVLKELHSVSTPPPTGFERMQDRFRGLFERQTAEASNSLWARGAEAARSLISSEEEVCVLHGDVHHENVVGCGGRGWLAIDPQALVGERTFDVANVFYNPMGRSDLVLSRERIDWLALRFAERLNLSAARILGFAFAYGCLRAAWDHEDGKDPGNALRAIGAIEAAWRSRRNLDSTFVSTRS